jgi:integrase/recombinase XerD
MIETCDSSPFPVNLREKENPMLEQIFVRPSVIARLRGGPWGPYLDDLATFLHHDGYAPSHIQRSVRAAEQFARWLHGHGIPVSALDDAVLQRYVAGLKRDRSGHLPKAAQGLGHLLRCLQRHGVVRPPHVVLPTSPGEQWLAEYDAHLAQVAGIALSTRRGYGRLVRRFMTACFDTSAPDWSSTTAAMITTFVTHEAMGRRGGGRKLPSVAVRSFLRLLVFRGVIRAGLAAAALAPPQWRHAALPPRLTPEEVERVLAVYHDGTASSRRNRAMLLRLARLGLRTQDVISLCLDNIDWADGRLDLQPGKTHRARSLPLPQDVGQALVAYVPGGRPQSAYRQVFLRCRPPFHPLTKSAVWWIVRQAFTHTGMVVPPGRTSHLFRHTVASQMVNHGARFKDVADVLGHPSLQTTAIYAKLDLDALAVVALPWRGGAR